MTTSSPELEKVVSLAEQLSLSERLNLIERLVSNIKTQIEPVKEPKKSVVDGVEGQPSKPLRFTYGVLAELGPGPSEEDIAEVRREMLANFPREDIA